MAKILMELIIFEMLKKQRVQKGNITMLFNLNQVI